VDAHPYPNRASGVIGLDGEGCGDGSRRAGEDREECIALGIDLAAEMLGESSSNHLPVVGKKVGILVATLMQQAR
jgi:hypothetical protein